MLHHCSGERRSPTACYTTALSAHGGSFLAEALLGGRQAEKLWSSTALLSKGGRTKLPGGGGVEAPDIGVARGGCPVAERLAERLV